MNPLIDTDTISNVSIPDQRQSGLGIASFVLSIISGVASIILIGYAGYVETTTDGGVAGDNTLALIIGLAFFSCVAMLLIGIILGAVGLAQKGRRKTFAAIGVGINILFAILIALLMWIGISQG